MRQIVRRRDKEGLKTNLKEGNLKEKEKLGNRWQLKVVQQTVVRIGF